MVAKGRVITDHIPVNNFEMIIGGGTRILFVTVSGLEQEVEKVTLPNRTTVSGGNTPSKEFTATMFEHHTVELNFMRQWMKDSLAAKIDVYKKNVTLIKKTVSGNVPAGITRQLNGVFVFNEKDADLDLSNEGDPAMVEFSFSFDAIDGFGPP